MSEIFQGIVSLRATLLNGVQRFESIFSAATKQLGAVLEEAQAYSQDHDTFFAVMCTEEHINHQIVSVSEPCHQLSDARGIVQHNEQLIKQLYDELLAADPKHCSVTQMLHDLDTAPKALSPQEQLIWNAVSVLHSETDTYMATPVSPPDAVITSDEHESEFTLQSQCSQDFNNNLLPSTELEAKGLADNSVILEDFAINSATCYECCNDSKFGRTQKICLTCYDIVLTDYSVQQSTQDVPPSLTTTNSCQNYSNVPALASTSSTAQFREHSFHEIGDASHSPSNSSPADDVSLLLPGSTDDVIHDVITKERQSKRYLPSSPMQLTTASDTQCIAQSSVHVSTQLNDIASLPSFVGSLPQISECKYMETLSDTQLSQPRLPDATTPSSTLVEDPSNKLPAQQASIHQDTTAVFPA